MAVDKEEKCLSELILYISKKMADDLYFGQVKLNKVLFFADFTAYGFLGRTITGVEYQHLSEGPAVRRMLPVQREMREAEKSLVIEPRSIYGFRQDRPVALRDPDLAQFSGEEIAWVDRWIDTFRPMTATEASRFSHDVVGWQMTDERDTIDPKSVFLSSCDPTPAQIARGQELAKKYDLMA
jgi:hypothetical protein